MRYSPVRLLCAVALVAFLVATGARSGDDASGPIQYSTDLSQPFTVYVMSAKDEAWSRSLVENLKYSGPVVHFVRTSLPLSVDNTVVQGAVYRAVEKPNIFYVVNGDAMLILGERWALGPAGAVSMHAPKSRNFIVCLNLDGGVPFLSSSPAVKGKITWKGNDWNRFK